MLEALSHGFMQNALLAGLLTSVACGLIGPLVVVNRLVFLAGGIAHAAYGGIGLATFMGWSMLPTTLGFTLAASGMMATVTLHSPNRADTVIGVLWAAGMAMGIILMDLTPGYNVDLMSLLFGSILTVPTGDLYATAVLDVLIACAIALFYRSFVTVSFDSEYARTRNLPVMLLHYLLPAMVGLAVVMIIRVVGLILVIALLTIPTYLAERSARSLHGMMLLATVYSTLFCSAGLLLAYEWDLTSGAAVISVATTTFFTHLGISFLRSHNKNETKIPE